MSKRARRLLNVRIRLTVFGKLTRVPNMVENNKIRRALTRAFVTVAHFVRRFQRGDYRARTYQKKKKKNKTKNGLKTANTVITV